MEAPKTLVDLDKCLRSGQCFSWNKHGDKWYGFINDNFCWLKQDADSLTHSDNITDDEVSHYLDLTTEYKPCPDILTSYEQDVVEAAQGIRIIRQPLFEVIVTQILEQHNTMKATEVLLNNLKQFVGLDCQLDNVTDYYFSTPELLQGIITVDDCNDLGFGYRSKYFMALLEFLWEHPDFLENLQALTYVDAFTKLTSLYGIGKKAANAICLFSLHHLNAFPIDVHIERVLKREYQGRLSPLRFHEQAGVIRQWMYYYEVIKERI